MNTHFKSAFFIAAMAVSLLAVSAPAKDLLARYPTQLKSGDSNPDHARPWEFQSSDIFRLSQFNLAVGNELTIKTRDADLGIGHCKDGAVWAVVIPKESGALTSSAAEQGEPVANIWLRFHPSQINHLFPPNTVSSDGNAGLISEIRSVVDAKFGSSWHAGMNAMIPEPKDLTVYVDTKSGDHRFFIVDTKAKTAEYVSAFNRKSHSPNITATSVPPVVIKTVPECGASDVPPGEFELKVTFSKEMMDQSWSWCTVWDDSNPEGISKPEYTADHRTCEMKVKLEPGKTYGYWLNTETFRHFQDPQGRAAVPYLLVFSTRETSQGSLSPANTDSAGSASGFEKLLNDDQQTILNGTNQRFRNFFDFRTFDGWSADERAALERKSLGALQGPLSREYYQAINTLAALHSTEALPALRQIAFDRADKDNRDRWMATRALGIMDDKQSIPQMIQLLYHGNANTRWWAQISLVRMTGTNFGKDWNAWGQWWNGRDGQPPYDAQIIRWWSGQPATGQLADSLNQQDEDFLNSLRPQTGKQYLQQQLKLARAGNYWAQFNLWEGYSQGTHDMVTNSAEATKWLSELVKGAYLAKFEPVNGFNPKTPQEMLTEFDQHCQLHSGKDSLGGASFFRTTKQGDKLIGSFLTATPDEFKTAIGQDSNFKLISIEQLTSEMFVAHEASAQESL